MASPPLIGLTLDAEPAGGFSRLPWYALRQNYFASVSAAGGLPVALPHAPELAAAYLERLDGLIITGGAFDIDPTMYGESTRHESVSLKETRTGAELALLREALRLDKPVLGICGGQQLLCVALGGTLIQHIPEALPHALAHEQTTPHDTQAHTVEMVAGTHLYALIGPRLAVNSSHHQAVRNPGRTRINARAPDGVIEGVEDPSRRFCIGVQWHPEYGVSAGDAALFRGLVAACG